MKWSVSSTRPRRGVFLATGGNGRFGDGSHDEGQPLLGGAVRSFVPAVALVFAVCPLLADGGAYFQNNGQQVLVGNSEIELAFSSTNGGLVNLVDKATGQDFLVQKNAYWNGFTFAYVTPGNNTPQNGSGGSARSVTFTSATTGTGIQVTIQFDKFIVNASPLNISATVVISVDNVSPLTTWQVSIANQDQIMIESITLPYLSGLGQMSTDPTNDHLAYPSLSGILFQDPVHNLPVAWGWGTKMYYPGRLWQYAVSCLLQRRIGSGIVRCQPGHGGLHKVYECRTSQ